MVGLICEQGGGDNDADTVIGRGGFISIIMIVANILRFDGNVDAQWIVDYSKGKRLSLMYGWVCYWYRLYIINYKDAYNDFFCLVPPYH
jgi:hypothetical protein